MRKINLFLFLFLFFSINLAYAFLTPVYPQYLSYPQNTEINIPLNILNSTYSKLVNNTSCDFYFFDKVGNEITSGNVIYNETEGYWGFVLNETHTKDTGTYNLFIYCNRSKNNVTIDQGFDSFDFEITEDGAVPKTESNINIESDVNIVFFVIVALVVFAFVFLVIGIFVENALFYFVSAILFLIAGLILITTEINGIDFNFTIGIGLVLILVGAFISFIAFKGEQ